mmetsp:Transcript_43340/g.114288  ORF Transcript_43340/g.114288 Transcript_43340/m.114288 type:complete len:388 (+) Transcript_43340:3054-4217(+)
MARITLNGLCRDETTWRPQELACLSFLAELTQRGQTSDEDLHRRAVPDPLLEKFQVALETGASCDGGSLIPKLMHVTWKEWAIPSKYSKMVAGCVRLHSHWDFMFWNDAQNEKLVQVHFPEFHKAYESLSGIKKADVARLVMLYVHGGVYVDMDVECRYPLDGILCAAQTVAAGAVLGEENDIHAVLLENRDAGSLVSNAVMISQRRHPFFLKAIHEIFEAPWCGSDPVQCSGPRLIERLTSEYRDSGDSHPRVAELQSNGTHSKLLRLPFEFFSPNIAMWNSATMQKACRSSGAHLDTSRGGVRETRKSQICRMLDRALRNPDALQTNLSYLVHHWQCSWCRNDPDLEQTRSIREVLFELGNASLHSTARTPYWGAGLLQTASDSV